MPDPGRWGVARGVVQASGQLEPAKLRARLGFCYRRRSASRATPNFLVIRRSMQPFINRSATAATPRLLVSIRSADEAVAAIEGGADLVDAKDPDRGSLGMVSPDVMRDIAAAIQAVTPIGNSPTSQSVALGELSEWAGCADVPVIPANVTFAKLGLSHMAGRAGWQAEWQRVRTALDLARGVPLKWVAVAYADVTQADSLPIRQVVDAAIRTECAGVLIDTFSKTGLSLLDFIEPDSLRQFSGDCHDAGMFAALAGSLRMSDLPQIASSGADIIAIRSAACAGGLRRANIDASRVREFRSAMSIPAEFRTPSPGRRQPNVSTFDHW